MAVAIVVIAAVAAPLVYLLVGSLHVDTISRSGAELSLQNWLAVYTTGKYVGPLGSTIVLALTVTVLSIALGGLLAWMLERTDIPLKRLLSFVLPMPIMISPLITTLAWIALAAPQAGFINALVRGWVPALDPLFDIFSFAGIVLVMTLHYTTFAYIAIRAALSTMDPALEDASYVLGVGPLGTARRMTLPLVRPALTASALLIFVFAAENFSVPTMLGSPVGLETLPSAIYHAVSVDPSKPGEAAAAGSLLLWLAVVGLAWQRRITSGTGRFSTVGGKPGGRRTIRLGGLRWLAAALGGIYVLMAIVLPYLGLVLGSLLKFVTPRITPQLLTLDNYAKVVNGSNVTALKNSLLLSVVGSFAGVALFLVISYILLRSDLPFRRALDYVTVLPTALPAVVLGVGLLWAFVVLPLPLYGTVLGLGVAYLVRYAGYGIRQTNVAVGQISPSLEEAARTLGAGPFRAFATIVGPLIWSSLRALWLTLFVLFSLEIGATIFLYSPASITLPVLLWNQTSSGSLSVAFAIAAAQATGILLIIGIGKMLTRADQSVTAG
jgi:iron(III) transport system permease protein